MSFTIPAPEDYLYDAQYGHPRGTPLMSFDCDQTPFHASGTPEKALVFLLRLCETYRSSDFHHKRYQKRENLRFAIPEIIKKKFWVPDEIEGIPVLVNKSIPVETSMSFTTNRSRPHDSEQIPSSQIFEWWFRKVTSSMYLFDCDNFDVYEIRNIIITSEKVS